MQVVFNPSQSAPGVYVQEVPSGSSPIAGVGTSTAGFIGVINQQQGTAKTETVTVEKETAVPDTTDSKIFYLKNYPPITTTGTDKTYKVMVANSEVSNATLVNEQGKSQIKFTEAPSSKDITVTYQYTKSTPVVVNEYTFSLGNVKGKKVGIGNGEQKNFALSQYAVLDKTKYTVTVDNVSSAEKIKDDLANKTSYVEFTTAPAKNSVITVDYQPLFKSVSDGDVKLCTNFSEFKKFFGDFSALSEQNTLAHAVYGFFRNGGTRCYVVLITGEAEIDSALTQFEAIDEIAIIAAPGITDKVTVDAIASHCKSVQDRVAILDCPKVDQSKINDSTILPSNSDYAAFYFPWIKVFDPITKLQNPSGDGLRDVPPSGHIAGVYARVDTQRGVYKAPANEVLVGAADLMYNISKIQQAGLNSQGINCIRNLNGNIRVWGARTIGGDANGEFKYINVRRLFNYLRESIDEGTQWTVFEPNSPDLWARIRRNVNAFLLTVWRSGALFGDTPEQAFYVKCDEETNPPEYRDRGMVVTEIGVAVVKPAEFVIFQLSQWAGPGGK